MKLCDGCEDENMDECLTRSCSTNYYDIPTFSFQPPEDDDEQMSGQMSGGQFGGSVFLQVERPQLMDLNFHLLEVSSEKLVCARTSSKEFPPPF